jgi:hypothetical protein
MAIAGAALPSRARAQDDDSLVQVVDRAKLYMTHYAFFEEPDPNVPAATYFDAATGQPTSELELAAPLQEIRWRHGRQLTAAPGSSKPLPYFVDPPGFPPLPAPPEIVGFLQQLTGMPAEVIAANTSVLLVAIGQIVGDAASSARRRGHVFEVQTTMHFQVRIRTGFLFAPAAIGVLTGYLDFGLLHQLIQLPPPPNASEIVVYDWRAPMTLSTEHRFIRDIAAEPPPVADPFPDGMSQISLVGSRVDDDGRYTIVGSAAPSQVHFIAPPELELFLFGGPLTDVELAVLQEGRLLDA